MARIVAVRTEPVYDPRSSNWGNRREHGSTAVVTTTERTFVIADDHGRAHWVNVRKGPAFGEQVAVSGSLQAGQKIVKRATDELREGASLR